MRPRRRRLAGALRLAALVAGSAVFSVPFAWLLLTSVKEDRDLVITGLSSLSPHVTETRAVMDPEAPGYAARVDGDDVVARPVGPAAPRLFEVVEPPAHRGKVLELDPDHLHPAPRRLEVVQAAGVQGVVLEDRPDGSVRVRLDTGEVRILPPGGFQRVRRPGLDTANYRDALDYLPEGAEGGVAYLRNTLTLALLNVVGTLLSSSLAACAFARLRFRGKGLLFALLLSTLLLPGGVTLLPQFLIFRSLGWIDTLAPLWAPAFLGSAFNIFILRQFFASIPAELDDSARIDGCTPLRSWWSILLPQVKPALVVIGIWTFMGSWNNFMGPLVYISSPENMPLSYALQLFRSERAGDPTLQSAFALMTILPVILVFFAAQRQIMENASLSGLGGR